MRCIYQRVAQDGNGKVIVGATVSVFLTGTSTAANIYAAASGGSAVNSVTTGSATSSAPGRFTFYVDRSDYDENQLFDIVISKDGFTSITYSNIAVDDVVWSTYSPPISFTSLDTTPSVKVGNFFKTANAGATTISGLDDGYSGKSVKILIQDGNTTIDFSGTTLKGNAGIDWTPSNGDWMECVYNGSNWYCSVHDCTL